MLATNKGAMMSKGTILRTLWRTPIAIIKGIACVFGGRVKDYTDDTWKGGGPEGPSSYKGGIN